MLFGRDCEAFSADVLESSGLCLGFLCPGFSEACMPAQHDQGLSRLLFSVFGATVVSWDYKVF